MTLPGFLERHALAGIRATSEALFPQNEYGAPDWKQTEMVPRTLEYLEELPPEQRRLMTLLFILVELASILLLFGFSRFSKHAPEKRAAAVRRWRRSGFLPLRVLGDALKASTTVIYMSHPAALSYIGEYGSCERPRDPLRPAARRQKTPVGDTA